MFRVKSTGLNLWTILPFLVLLLLVVVIHGFVTPFGITTTGHQRTQHRQKPSSYPLLYAEAPTSPNAAPVLNGKRVLPYKVLMAGLKGHKVAGVFALLNNEYKRGSPGWEQCEHIGVSMDLDDTIGTLVEEHSSDKIAHIRAMSFVVPSQGAMEEIANDWRDQAIKVGGKIHFDPVMAAIEYLMEEEDDEDEDDDEEFLEMQAEALSMARGAQASAVDEEDGTVVSPFSSTSLASGDGDALVFNKGNVDKVLDEIRPYLINDGGNVSVERVDEDTRSVYLKLEGACGSCPSSTVTMQMGIERVLKENFENLGEVLQVEDEEEKPTELTYQVVEQEVNRIKGAIIAMGGMVEIVSVDADGLVELKFRGANKVRQGLELAIMDIDFVKEVRFLFDDDE